MDKKKAENKIRLEGLSLNMDQSMRVSCPFCEAEHERSLSVTRQQFGLLYNCYRVRCKARGFISSIPDVKDFGKKGVSFVPKQFTRELVTPTSEISSYIASKYSISKAVQIKQGFKYVPEGHRLYMPIFDILGREIGGVTKKLPIDVRIKGALPSTDDGPKSVVYWFNDVPKLHFPIQGMITDKIVLVEDSLSATRIAEQPNKNAAALLGTNIDGRQMLYLAQHFKHAVFILDADATTAATAMAEKCNLLFRSTKVVQIDQDPKDMSADKFATDILSKI